jgi:hypothetical protein
MVTQCRWSSCMHDVDAISVGRVSCGHAWHSCSVHSRAKWSPASSSSTHNPLTSCLCIGMSRVMVSLLAQGCVQRMTCVHGTTVPDPAMLTTQHPMSGCPTNPLRQLNPVIRTHSHHAVYGVCVHRLSDTVMSGQAYTFLQQLASASCPHQAICRGITLCEQQHYT